MRTGLFLLWLVGAPAAGALERPPAVAGRFYTAEPGALREQIDRLLDGAKPAKPKGKVLALLVPHAGLEFSGEAAAYAYKAIEPSEVETILLVGSAHYLAVDGAALYPGAYSTPIGGLPYDEKLAERLLAASKRIRARPEAHEREHSIEVNVPFLVRRFPKAKLVAMVMNAEDLETALEVGGAIAKAVKGRKVLVAASTDLSHYPPGGVADRVDATTLHALGSLDPAFFYSVNRFWMDRSLPNLRCTYCGEGAVTAVLAAAKALGAGRAELLRRYHSGDAIPERGGREVVGYAAVAFVQGRPDRTAYGLSEADRKALLREARGGIERALAGAPPANAELSANPAFNLPAAVFVTLEVPGPDGGKLLRGCIGSTEPRGTLLEAVRNYALQAAFHDSRFKPIDAAELPSVRLEVSILSPRRPVLRAADVEPKEHGVTVEQGARFGVFLPQVWEQLPEKAAFLAELCEQKAGLPRDCASDPKTQLSVFTVESFGEPWGRPLP